MSFHDVFGSATLPPAELGFLELTITADTTLLWPYNTNDAAVAIAKITDISCAPGNSVTLPDATEVSVGEDFLFRNVGAEDLTVKDVGGNTIATVAIGAASYFYLTNNATSEGQFGVIGFGVGTSSVDAGSLVGYGVKAIGSSLNQAHPVVPTASGVLVDSDSRAKLIVFTGGVGTMTFVAAATLGNDFFTMFRNEGTGTLTLAPDGIETIDSQLSIQVQPGESLMLVCTGTAWFSVGYGRSTLYQFTQLTKDVSAAGTITLTAAEASNKLITFIGNPASTVTVVIPPVVAIYYTYSGISTAQTIILKTETGSGIGLDQNARIIALCDGTNVLSAQSAVANATVSLTDGNVASPSLFFATQTNTGLYKQGAADIGFSVLGVNVGAFTAAGLLQATIGVNTLQRHIVPAAASDTVALLNAVQSLTNKTFTGPTNVTVNSASAALTITQEGAGNVLEVKDVAGDTTFFLVDSSGNVIAGGSITVRALVDIVGTGGAEGGQLTLWNKENTAGKVFLDVDSDGHGRLFTTVNNTNIIIGQIAGTGGLVAFHTGAAERMRITAAGLVGIGLTPTGNYTLETLGAIGATYSMPAGGDLVGIDNTSAANNTTKYAGLAFYGRDTVSTRKMAAVIRSIPVDSDYVNSALAFFTRIGDAVTERMRIDQKGDVGIGVSNIIRPAGCAKFLAIGDNDTGIGQLSDGRTAIYGDGLPRMVFEANGHISANSTGGEINFNIGPQTNGGYLFGGVDNIGFYSPTTGASLRVSKNAATRFISLDSGSNTVGKIELTGQQATLYGASEYTGYRVRSITASGSAIKYGLVEFANENNIATTSIISTHNTNGSGDIVFSLTPPGSRTVDRRYTGLKLNGSSGHAELTMPLVIDYTSSNSNITFKNTASNGIQLSLQANGVNGNRTLRLLDGIVDIVNHAYSAQSFVVTDTYLGTNIVRPMVDNVVSCGAAGYRYSVVYAASGTINTSDAREKTAIRPLTSSEIEAAKQMGKEIGAYQWLASVAEKGTAGAREHIGLTVQRAIEILEANGLTASDYGFICFDQWKAAHQEWPAIEAVEYQAATYDEEGNELTPEVQAVEGRAAFTQTLSEGGDRYSFRYDELNLFIARGFEARLSALEAAL